jgi:hypothetical protein
MVANPAKKPNNNKYVFSLLLLVKGIFINFNAIYIAASQNTICGESGNINNPAIMLVYKEVLYNITAIQPVRWFLSKHPILKISHVAIADETIAVNLNVKLLTICKFNVNKRIKIPTNGGWSK